MSDSGPGLTPELRSEFLQLIQGRFGIRNSDYIARRLDSGVADLLPRTTCSSPAELLDALRSEGRQAWLEALAEHLTVGETYFFRDPALVAALRTVVLPELIQRRAPDRRLRIWSAGCSTGEEPYTLAILLQQQMVELDNWDVLLVGTDVNRASLRIAREAVYEPWSFRAVSDEFRARYFHPTGKSNAWQLTERVRRLVRFGWTNLAADPLTPPSAELDLILCRNVTIYFDAATTERLYNALIAALAPGGWLVLGPSDPMPNQAHNLERIDAAETVVWRRPALDSGARDWRRPRSYPARPLPAGRSVLSVRDRASDRAPAPRRAPPVVDLTLTSPPTSGDHEDALRAGLVALESESYASAVQWLRRATFRNPNTPVGQFALAKAYLGLGDTTRAQAALAYADRLLARLGDGSLGPGSESLSVAGLRQTVRAHLAALPGA
jgi:chemotaxis protein methyltransferase CheR